MERTKVGTRPKPRSKIPLNKNDVSKPFAGMCNLCGKAGHWMTACAELAHVKESLKDKEKAHQMLGREAPYAVVVTEHLGSLLPSISLLSSLQCHCLSTRCTPDIHHRGNKKKGPSLVLLTNECSEHSFKTRSLLTSVRDFAYT